MGNCPNSILDEVKKCGWKLSDTGMMTIEAKENLQKKHGDTKLLN